MKILSAEQIRRADAYTIEHEPIQSIDLMERAAQSFCNWFVSRFSSYHPVSVFCGTGNNCGDGLAIARILIEKEYSVNVYVLRSENESDDFKQNETRLGPPIVDIKDDLPATFFGEIIIDALFGTGLSRPLDGVAAKLVEHLNSSNATRVSVDIPSGMYADKPTTSIVFKADHTFTFHAPKLAFLLPQEVDNVGELHIGNIGLHPDIIANETCNNCYLTADSIILKKRHKFSHKGTYGHALIVAGSYGKIGAAILASHASLRSGTGLVTLETPECGYTSVQAALPEVMVVCHGVKVLSRGIELGNYDAIGIGPGIGLDKQTNDALFDIIAKTKRPMVLDADALNIIADNRKWLGTMPKGSILTPHPKEFERLFGQSKNPFDRLELLRTRAKEFGLHIILKGANTAIACPDGTVWFNSTGNPGMATGGTGDVLTGIITGLLAQGYSSTQAALFGVYVHGLAGDFAASSQGMESMVASDIIANLGKAFNALQHSK